ncbi:peptide ABC transporter ATP-binding protein [Actinoplanes sp. ATCC 53533]|uniref:ABC transporter ATP-binding protein n=1 Tax=Actinoplanes sp. ATCC 53533 TaxID=1288362 RepID=UPI000F792C03|nr:ABC transporter ATP-binding protein [Actinoplanes sp. ATCC 53533]RSM55736.1 peptide ABC transporter ATP-binding protein [Actinoplanes sp. ATCC 53533]
MTTTHAVRADELVKVYGEGETTVTAVDKVNVTFPTGEFTAIVGPSGSGKSTLMHLLAGLDTATSGSIQVGGVELTGLSDRDLTVLRRDRIGFVFQAFNLLPTLTAEQNILLPGELAGRRPDRHRLAQVAADLGLADRLHHRPAQLSGGQQQRVACARALMSRPEVVFADEPTGSLDTRTGADVLRLLRRSVREWGQTVVMVTHDPVAAGYADRVVVLADGRIVDELWAPTPDGVADRLQRLGA